MESIQLSQQVSKGLLDLELIDEEVLRSLCLWCVAKLLGKEVVEQGASIRSARCVRMVNAYEQMYKATLMQFLL
jgi:hypothetical protein